MFHFTQEPHGAFPTEGKGVIEPTGQAFYFRYRGGRASLTISEDDRVVYGREDACGVARYFEQRVVSEDAMPIEMSTALVTAWLTLYLAEPRQHPALTAIQQSPRWS
jgi:hypothetical protein